MVDCLSHLVSKSLVTAHIDFGTRYTLSHITRAYASEKLAESGRRDEVSSRHLHLVASKDKRRAIMINRSPGHGDARWSSALKAPTRTSESVRILRREVA